MLIPGLLFGGLTALPATTALATAPTVSSVSPNFGFECGGASVKITGTGFTGATEVDFGGSPVATGQFSVVNDTEIDATTPPHDPSSSPVDVTVKVGGASGTDPGAFTYEPEAAAVSSINPTSGNSAGGTTVTVHGGCFVDLANVLGVQFGGTDGSNVANVTDTSLTVMTPKGTAGAANVIVDTLGGSSCPANNNTCTQFTYIDPPGGTSISPSSGGQNTQVTVTAGFSSPQASCPFTAVTFGGVAATSPSNCQPAPSQANPLAWSEKVLAPAGEGTVPVVAFDCPDCGSTGNAGFTYLSPPEVDSVTPPAGPSAGGSSVTITGKGFAANGACIVTEVDFGPGNPAPTNGPLPTSPFSCSATSITVSSPSGSGLVDVQVITSQGTSPTNSNDKFLYTGIAVTSVSPDGGPAAGGNSVTLRGYGFTGASAIDFGSSNPASSFTVVSDTQIFVPAAPAHTPGMVDVTVTTPQGTSGTTSGDKYSYTTAPVIASLSPTSGPASGGNSVAITGAGFFGNSGACDVTSVTFASSANGNIPAATWSCTDDNHVTVTVPQDTSNPPEGTATDPATVNLTTDGGAAPAGQTYTYVANPTVTSVSPSSGSTAGGTTVTIHGTHFESNTSGPSCDVKSVSFGTAAADVSTISNCTDISFQITAPAATNFMPGTVDVTVTTNNGGTSETNPPGDEYTYLANYYFTWYDRISSPGFQGDNIHVLNPGGVTAHVNVSIPGSPPCVQSDVAINAGREKIFTCSSGFGGPVQITSDAPIVAGQRVQYFQSFNEVPAMPDFQAAKALQFAWYDRISSPGFQGDNIHVVNPGTATANVTVNIPGCSASMKAVAPGGYQIFTCATGFGGPVTLTSDQPVLASQRVQYFQSFNEEWGQNPANAGNQLSFSWFDRISDPGFTADNVHVWYPATGGGAPASTTVTVQIPGCQPQNQIVKAQGEAIFSCAGFGGAVTIISNQPVLASQRVQYYQSFNEVPAVAPSAGAKTSYFVWYDRISNPGFKSDNIHVWNFGTSTATGEVDIPGCDPQPLSVAPGSFAIFTCAGGFGGPVKVTADNPVLASQRVQYYQSFNEVLADN